MCSSREMAAMFILRNLWCSQRKISCRISRHLCSSVASPPNRIPGTSLLAYLMAPKLEISFEDSLVNFEENQEMVATWHQDMIEDGMEVIYSDSQISIIDFEEKEFDQTTLCRGLYFNENLDLIQTAVPLNKETKQVDFAIPLPLESNKHIVGFSFALLFHSLNCQTPSAPPLLLSSPRIHRSAVLGAGGCSLPILLSLLSPRSHIDAIENCSSVVKVAKEYFGIAALGLESRVQLHESCAMDWIRLKWKEIEHQDLSLRYDLLFLDIYEVPSSPIQYPSTMEDVDAQVDGRLDCEAPAENTLTNENISLYLNLLADSGVMAINVLGNDLGTAVALHRIEAGIIEYLTTLPSTPDDGSSPYFAVGIMNLPYQSQPPIPQVEAEENKNEGEEPLLPRYNSIIFIVKSPTLWFQELMKEKKTEKLIERITTAMDHLTQGNEVAAEGDRAKVRYPFERQEKEEKEILRKWIETTRFIQIKR
jgi:hypothetical protein